MTVTRPTQTSYAVLGLLALRPWTTYELARQSERSLRWFFPRAERAVYLEAKRLVELRWARAKRTATGRRSRTVYSITRTGESALRAWLAAPSAPTQIESEAALKVFLSDRDDLPELRAAIADIRTHAGGELTQLAAMAAETHSAFPQRVSTNVLSMRLIADLHQAIHDWTTWAEQAVAVLATGDPRQVERQTDAVLDRVMRAGR